jgi:hypothetical protein
VLQRNFGRSSDEIFERNTLIQYINLKTRSANRGSKSRGSFGALYSIYTLIEDYIGRGFLEQGNYSESEGVRQSYLIDRQRQLPFGEKLQNHYYQNRTNTDYRKFFPAAEIDKIIIHNQEDSRYWINESLLRMSLNGQIINLASAVIQIIDEYVKIKQDAFNRFIESCERLQTIETNSSEKTIEFIDTLLAPNVDARLFEIVSYAILKYYYHDQIIFWGYSTENLNEENLKLYKTGRTNANDGGIDFVMKPLGRFFQVTETLDFKKYFLDIDKIQRYPITFVIKSTESIDTLIDKIKEDAQNKYPVKTIVKKYMDSIEEIINIPALRIRFEEAVRFGYLSMILNEIVLQSKVEFNYEGFEDDEE